MFALAAGPRGPLRLPLTSCSSSPFLFFLLKKKAPIDLKRKMPSDIPNEHLGLPPSLLGAAVGSRDEWHWMDALNPTLKLSMCLATTMQCRFLSPVKNTEDEEPCAGVVNSGQLLDPLWATGEGHNFPQPRVTTWGHGSLEPECQGFKKRNQCLWLLFLPPSAPPSVWMIYSMTAGPGCRAAMPGASPRQHQGRAHLATPKCRMASRHHPGSQELSGAIPRISFQLCPRGESQG